jgi:UDP-3-O-[3-hydroxymyristoyl] glucosamine N-acyltransferase
MDRLEFAKQQIASYRREPAIRTPIPEWVWLGNKVSIHAGVYFSDAGFGYEKIGGEWVHIPHSGIVSIGHGVEVFSGTNIVRATADDGVTAIGAGTKIDYNCHIAHNVKIGKRCLIIAGAIIGGSVEIGDDCYLGIGCMIKNKVKIGNGVTIGMGAVVLKDVPDGATVVGNPGRVL